MNTLDMSPFLSSNNSVDVHHAYGKHLSKFMLVIPEFVKASYFKYFYIGEFNPSSGFSFNSCHASLGDHISAVVLRRASEQMNRSYTTRIIAMVTSKYAFWQWANSRFQRHSIGRCTYSIPSNYSVSTIADFSVPLNAWVRFPWKRVIVVLDGIKEINKVLSVMLVSCHCRPLHWGKVVLGPPCFNRSGPHYSTAFQPHFKQKYVGVC